MNTKKSFVIILGTILALASFVKAQSPTPLEQPLANFDKLVSQLKSGAVIGDPITAGTTTIIPFAKLSFGLGGGGAMMAYGGGMSGKAIPQGVLIIEGENVRVELIPEEEKKPSFILEMLPVLLKLLPDIMGPKPPAAVPTAGATPAGLPANASLDQVKKLFHEKKYAEALEMADGLLAKDPNNADLHAWKGHAMGNLAQGNPANMIKYGMGASQEYETALKLDPQNADGHFGRAMVRLQAPPGFGGNVDGAIADLEATIAKAPSPEAYYYLGEALKNKGLNDKAAAAYKKALELRPNYPEASKALAALK
jgi:uncharacterized spore protein YtfJ